MEDKISLLELQEKIKGAVDAAVPETVWVTAEISEMKGNTGGHCYLDLVDYNGQSGAVAAKARAIIWSRGAAMLIPFFKSATGSDLCAGMHVLLKVQVQYSVAYGLTLNVLDVDPSFTVGELELQRQRIIQRLQQEGMFDVNTSLELPVLPKRLAVISSQTAAGYRDFMKHLHENESGFSFYTQLFPAPMQGNDAPQGIIRALEQIAAETSAGSRYDAVVIIRGGGGAIELACFDDYDLALNIAQFPLPVLTGIGHDHDFHVADMVAHTHLKTPTAVADYILDLYLQQAGLLESLHRRAVVALSYKINNRYNDLLRYADRLKSSIASLIVEKKNKLQLVEYKLHSLNLQEVLNKGFVIVADKKGKRAVSVDDIPDTGTIRLIMKDGTVEMTVGVLKKVKNK